MPRGLAIPTGAGDTTPAEFGEVTVSPQTMAFDSEVRVKVSVSCPYGLRNVCIVYFFDDDESYVLFASPMRSFASRRHLVRLQRDHSRAEGGPEGDFRIRAITAYNVVTYTIPGRTRFPTKRGMKNPNNPLNNEIAILWN